jgi:hypothetical protein
MLLPKATQELTGQQCEDIEKHPLVTFGIDERTLKRARWLETYTAYDIYRLCRAQWKYNLRSDRDAETQLKKWENGKGQPILLEDLGQYSEIFHIKLLDMILPEISSMVYSGPQRYINPPSAGWEDRLKSWRSFLTDPVSWGIFVQFGQRIENFLFYDWPGDDYLNSVYIERLRFLSETQLKRLPNIFRTLINAKQRRMQARLSTSDFAILDNLIKIAADLTLGSTSSQWTLSELTIPQSDGHAEEN